MPWCPKTPVVYGWPRRPGPATSGRSTWPRAWSWHTVAPHGAQHVSPVRKHVRLPRRKGNEMDHNELDEFATELAEELGRPVTVGDVRRAVAQRLTEAEEMTEAFGNMNGDIK